MTIQIHPFPYDAESNGFFAALTSAVMHCHHITEDTPVYCAPKGKHCNLCHGCGIQNRLQKHHIELYHALLTASAAAFTFDYPEDDDVEYHTMPDTPIGWRWDNGFVDSIMDICGLTYHRYNGKSAVEMYDIVHKSVEDGYTALCANYSDGVFTCWSVVNAVTDNGIRIMKHGGNVVNAEGVFDDWLVIEGRCTAKQTYRDVLERIYAVLTDPSHEKLEAELIDELKHVTEENAAGMAYKLMGICGVFTETRWHAAEGMTNPENLVGRLAGNADVKKALGDIAFSRYIADNNNESHCIGWRIWGCLGVGPETGYMPTEQSFALIREPEVQAELARLYRIVFENDKIVAAAIRKGMDNHVINV